LLADLIGFLVYSFDNDHYTGTIGVQQLIMIMQRIRESLFIPFVSSMEI
jgi:hypothetical protein